MADSIYEDGRQYECLWAGRGADIAFWIDRLEGFGGPVLELACGTGKELVPASAAGLDIFGLDRSEAMLAEARRKRECQCPEAGVLRYAAFSPLTRSFALF
jgi:SAM-dependent methyltransferase